MMIFDLSAQIEYDLMLSRSKGEEPSVCPKCSHDRKKVKDKCLNWNHDKQTGFCHHCQTSFVVKSDRKVEKIYYRPKFNNATQLSDNLVKYFQGRGISQDTLKSVRITEGIEWMPQERTEVNTIQFNYFRSSELINTKFRDAKKNFKLVKDAELILYNLDSIVDADTVIITEGEMDCLSWIEAGFTNVVSVPNGAAKNQKMEFLDNCANYFDGKIKIFLSTDNDEPGRALRDELARRLGIERCYKIDFGNLKDANEYLIYHGTDKMQLLIDQAKEFPIEGIYSINETWNDIEDIYNNGMPKGAKTGDTLIDDHIGFMPGELTIVTGIPGHGKSIYLDQISIGLAINSGWRFGICSPESFPLAFYFTRLIKRIIGKKFSRNNITLAQLNQVRDWLTDRYFMIMPKNGYSLDEIISRAKQLVMRKGINAVILDPWNRLEKNIPQGMTESNYIVLCLTKLIEFAQSSGVHVFLVAHPTKMQKEKDGINFQVPNLYSISGSAHFFNVPHNGFTVFRNAQSAKTEVHFQKIKWEHLGKVGMIEYVYNQENARFDNIFKEDYSNWMETRINPQPQQSSFDDEVNKIYPNIAPPF